MDFYNNKNITIFSHPLIKHKISLLRDRESSTNKFRQLVEEIAMLEAYEALKKNEEISQVLGDISSTVTDTTIKINGDESGIASYSYVVSLLLNYYDGILF